MKADSICFFVSILFSLIWLLLKDVISSGLQLIALLRYVPILLLYAKFFRKGIPSFLPILFGLFLMLLRIIGNNEYDYLGLLVLTMVPVSLYVFSKIKFTRKQVGLIKSMFFLSFVLYVALSVLKREIVNPNQIGFTYLILFVNFFICSYINSNSKDDKLSPVLVVFWGIVFILILLTESRNSLMVLVLLPIAYYFRKKIDCGNRLVLLLIGILILYLVYPWVYCLLAYNSSFRASQGTEVMNQDIFSGREIIWSYVYNELTHPSFFLYGGIDTEWWGKSLHNSALDIVVRYGVPTMIVLSLVIVYYFKIVYSLIRNKFRPLLLLVLVTMIWGIHESGMFLGYSFFLFLPYSLILSKNRVAD